MTETHRPPDHAHRRDFQVVFLCTANICRSAYAGVIAAPESVPGVEFRSAGTHALVGRRMDPPMVEQLPAGIDASHHRAHQLSRRRASEADLIVSMADVHTDYVVDEWPALMRRTFLIGQVARGLDNAPTGTRLDDLTDLLWADRSRQPGDEVADPYGRGRDAAQVAARSIDDKVARIVAGLRRLTGGTA